MSSKKRDRSIFRPYKAKGYPVSPLLEKEKPALPTGKGRYFKQKFGL